MSVEINKIELDTDIYIAKGNTELEVSVVLTAISGKGIRTSFNGCIEVDVEEGIVTRVEILGEELLAKFTEYFDDEARTLIEETQEQLLEVLNGKPLVD